MNKEYINEYHHLETTHWWFIIRKKIILQAIRKFILPHSPARPLILNAGAAAGASSKWLSAIGEVSSVENDSNFLAYLRSVNFPVVNASLTSLPFEKESFDIVCAFDVIEHIPDHQKAVSELLRVCKNGGYVCLTVPAFQSLWGTHDSINNHQRRYSAKQLRQLFTIGNNKILYMTYFNSILFIPIFLFRKLTALFKKKHKPVSSDFSYFKTSGFINVIFKSIFSIEPYLLKWMKFPFGVSLILLLQKEPVPEQVTQ